MNKKCIIPLLTLGLIGSANAHISISSDPAIANSRQVLTFNVGHGCQGADTAIIEVSIPESISSLRIVDAADTYSSFERDDESQRITKVMWERDAAAVYSDDVHFYQYSIRVTVPDLPHTTLHFPTVQTCRAEDGTEYVAEWVGMGSHDHDAVSTELPAPALYIYPDRQTGWNKYTATNHIHDLSVFDDAEIVWSGSAAYSSNIVTMEQIINDPDVTVLTQIHPDMEIWVKY